MSNRCLLSKHTKIVLGAFIVWALLLYLGSHILIPVNWNIGIRCADIAAVAFVLTMELVMWKLPNYECKQGCGHEADSLECHYHHLWTSPGLHVQQVGRGKRNH